MRRFALLLCLAAAEISAQPLTGGERVEFEVRTDSGGAEKIFAHLYRPAAAAGKSPAIVIVHGSAGVTAAREGFWARELATGREWPLTDDAQDVDDQVEWIDSKRVIYGRLYGTGAPETTLSVWVSTVTPESGLNQQLFIQSASSPSIIR